MTEQEYIGEFHKALGTLKQYWTGEMTLLVVGYALGWAFKEWGLIVLVIGLLYFAFGGK